MHVGRLDEARPFTTLDGSTIREVSGRASLPSENQSLAEATVPVGAAAIAEVTAEWTAHLGEKRMAALREILTDLREITDPWA